MGAPTAVFIMVSVLFLSTAPNGVHGNIFPIFKDLLFGDDTPIRTPDQPQPCQQQVPGCQQPSPAAPDNPANIKNTVISKSTAVVNPNENCN
ncbi:unnamed protein product [Arctia plantaginis]|uniref:Uncharacterized protein n=1 Tax=Arctia plantaginis TaxID=874455 RepID=A0A8S1AKF7_ARCPL|nr:unnamed protein product [Arctia plantaginis]CAB3245521.1 unnamed protein product [Arctia plantaginis]